MSKLFTKTRREDPKDEVAKNAKLLIRAGYIHKEIAGVYSFLPLGLLVLEKIMAVIREEMNHIGGTEILMSALQDPVIWRATDRWNDARIDIWFKTALKNDNQLGLAITHEEPVTRMLKEHIQSYRDLPVFLYQFQTKFRNETRAKSGILRGREFLMKDLYSFTRNEQELNDFYNQTEIAYRNIFNRVGLGKQTYLTFASGGVFSRYSHEFQTLCPVGEDIIYLSAEKGMAVNREVFTDRVLADLGLRQEELHEVRAIEVGNIFKLGTRFSEALELFYLDETGKKTPVVMGSYGIGLTRLLGAIVEVLSDDGGIIWPKAVAPYQLQLVSLGETEAVIKDADKLYDNLKKNQLAVLYDDRPLSAGEKLADADLLGMPLRVVVSEKTITGGGHEVSIRQSGEVVKLTLDQLLKKCQE